MFTPERQAIRDKTRGKLNRRRRLERAHYVDLTTVHEQPQEVEVAQTSGTNPTLSDNVKKTVAIKPRKAAKKRKAKRASRY